MARNDAGLEPAAEGLYGTGKAGAGSFLGTDQPVRYAVISILGGWRWEFIAMTRTKSGFWRPSCSEGTTCRRCPFNGGGGGRPSRDRCMFFPSKEAAVISAAAMGVEVWNVRPDARWRASDRDMKILA